MFLRHIVPPEFFRNTAMKLYAKLAGFTDSRKFSRSKEVKITVKDIVMENYRTNFQFLILV
jgi:hypothetical protein